jgi:hypothetical protein
MVSPKAKAQLRFVVCKKLAERIPCVIAPHESSEG